MNIAKRVSVALAGALLAAVLVAEGVSAKSFSGAEQCNLQKEGETLTGAIYIEVRPNSVGGGGEADVVIRLRKGQKLKAFYCTATIANPDDPCVVQAAVEQECSGQIRDAFYPGESRQIGLNNVSEVGIVEVTNLTGQTFRHILGDVTVSAK